MNSKYSFVTKTAAQHMLSALTRGLVIPLALFGALAGASTASASVQSNHSGTICKNYNAAEATLIDYINATGTRSVKVGVTDVICPLTRNTNNVNGALITVGIEHIGAQTTSCLATSHDSLGRLLFSSPVALFPGQGLHTFVFNLTGAGKSTASSNYSVFCTIPGNQKGIINSVNITEQ
jgi:hypothetical protein